MGENLKTPSGADAQALKALLAKAKAGDVDNYADALPMVRAWRSPLEYFKVNDWVVDAYNGDLNAAKALHDAVLPGWEWCCATVGNDIGTPPTARLRKIVSVEGDGVVSAENKNPARAWLIAILKALISQADEAST